MTEENRIDDIEILEIIQKVLERCDRSKEILDALAEVKHNQEMLKKDFKYLQKEAVTTISCEKRFREISSSIFMSNKIHAIYICVIAILIGLRIFKVI